MSVQEHKQNSAKLLFAFHISWTRSIPATLAVCSSNTKLFIATLILLFVMMHMFVLQWETFTPKENFRH